MDYLAIDMSVLFEKFPNELAKHPHNDRWPLRDSEATSVARGWFDRVTAADKPSK